MQATCPHAVDPAEQCPPRCAFAQCYLPQHETTSDPALVFQVDVDRRAAAKELCTYCTFFLGNGPSP
jgi:hypothetical protein